MRSRAFAPGHVSGLFAVHDAPTDVLRRGSRGAGWSLDRGATATVEEAGSTQVRIDGADHVAPVTRKALAHLAPGRSFGVDVRLDLPVGQGFGMSAAGTLAACLAACDLLRLEPERALEATHAAEVRHGTGLGDAVGAWFGGAEVRPKEGCPPHGWALRIEAPADTRFLFAVLGEPVATADVIRDPAWAARTREAGDAAVDRILKAGRADAWEALLRESHGFSLALGLMADGMRRLGESLPAGVAWGQCMLGNTLWATGPAAALDGARATLAAAGPVLEARIDPNGARLVRLVNR